MHRAGFGGNCGDAGEDLESIFTVHNVVYFPLVAFKSTAMKLHIAFQSFYSPSERGSALRKNGVTLAPAVETPSVKTLLFPTRRSPSLLHHTMLFLENAILYVMI